MTAVLDDPGFATSAAEAGVWGQGWQRFRRDPLGLAALWVVALFGLVAILSAAGIVASDWNVQRAVSYANPTFLGPSHDEATIIAEPPTPIADLSAVDPLAPKYAAIAARAAQLATREPTLATTLPFGADRAGRDILVKVVKGSEVSIVVGLAAALFATLLGTFLGALSGFVRGVVGDVLEWFYNVFTSIPSILLIFCFAAVLGRGVTTVIVILGLTGWTGTYRLLRAEYIKHANREYVRAAEAIGASSPSRMFGHILPNVSHVVLVQLSLSVVSFIKAEVIVSFLGLGVPIDSVSWGTMLSEAQSELVQGKWWQLVAVTVVMAVFVTAFSLFTDALRDALDPKLR